MSSTPVNIATDDPDPPNSSFQSYFSDVTTLPQLMLQDCPFIGPRPSQEDLEHRDLEVRTPWLTAKDSGLLDSGSMDLSPRIQEQRAKQLTRLIYAIHHRIDDIMMELTIPAYLSGQDSEKRNKAIRKSIDRVYNWERSVVVFIKNGVRKARQTLTPEVFDNATPELRMTLWFNLFKLMPHAITAGMLGATASAVDLDNIFLGDQNNPIRQHWRDGFGTMFMWACQSMVHHFPGARIEEDGYYMQGWYNDWRNFTNKESFNRSFPEWNLANVPVGLIAGNRTFTS